MILLSISGTLRCFPRSIYVITSFLRTSTWTLIWDVVTSQLPSHHYLLDPTAFFYQFGGHDMEEKSNILFFSPFLGLWIEIKYYVAHIFYGQTISHNKSILFFNNNGKYFYLVKNIQQHFIWVLHRQNCKYLNLEENPLFWIFTYILSSHHRPFLIIPHI